MRSSWPATIDGLFLWLVGWLFGFLQVRSELLRHPGPKVLRPLRAQAPEADLCSGRARCVRAWVRACVRACAGVRLGLCARLLFVLEGHCKVLMLLLLSILSDSLLEK